MVRRKGGGLGVIEYQGIQHYEPVGFGGDGNSVLFHTRQNDEIKRQWCCENGTSLLEIPYWGFNQIEILVTQFVNDI